MAFIVDSYNKYDQWDRAHSLYTFTLNENWYAIKEVELEWGRPVLPIRIGEEQDEYYVYGSYEEAQAFVRKIKKINCADTY